MTMNFLLQIKQIISFRIMDRIVLLHLLLLSLGEIIYTRHVCYLSILYSILVVTTTVSRYDTKASYQLLLLITAIQQAD